MINEKIGGGAGTATLGANIVKVWSGESPIWSKVGNVVTVNSGLLKTTAEIATNGVVLSGLPKSKQNTRFISSKGIGTAAATQMFSINGTTVTVAENGTLPSGTYFALCFSYIAAE